MSLPPRTGPQERARALLRASKEQGYRLRLTREQAVELSRLADTELGRAVEIYCQAGGIPLALHRSLEGYLGNRQRAFLGCSCGVGEGKAPPEEHSQEEGKAPPEEHSQGGEKDLRESHSLFCRTGGPGKHPKTSGHGLFYKEGASLQERENWLLKQLELLTPENQMRAACNVGLLTGSFISIDFDSPSSQGELESELGFALPPTFSVETGFYFEGDHLLEGLNKPPKEGENILERQAREGHGLALLASWREGRAASIRKKQVFYALPEGLPPIKASKIYYRNGDPIEKLDVRGQGALVAVPPSRHYTRAFYSVLDALEMREAPEELVALIMRGKGETRPPSPPVIQIPTEPLARTGSDYIPPQRTREKLDLLSREIRSLQEGERHTGLARLYTQGASLACDTPSISSEIESELLQAGLATGLPAKEVSRLLDDQRKFAESTYRPPERIARPEVRFLQEKPVKAKIESESATPKEDSLREEQGEEQGEGVEGLPPVEKCSLAVGDRKLENRIDLAFERAYFEAKSEGLLEEFLRIIPLSHRGLLDLYSHTDDSTASLFLLRHFRDVRFLRDRGSKGTWIVFDQESGLWSEGGEELLEPLIGALVEDLRERASANEFEYLEFLEVAKKSKTSFLRRLLARFETTKSRAAWLERVRLRVSIRVSQCNQLEPYEFACKGGLLDLRDCSLSPLPRLRYLLTASELTPSKSKSHIFESFLRDVFPSSPEMYQYARKVLGYCLTGSVREQAFFLFVGVGANGKSTLFKVLKRVLGAFYCLAPRGLFVSRAGESQEKEGLLFTTLAGKRLAVCDENDDIDVLESARIKKLTGDSRALARAHFRDFEEIPLQAKFILSTNALPSVPDSSEGMHRRIRVLRLQARFIDKSELDSRPRRAFEKVREKDYEERLVTEEALSGALHFLAQAARDYLREGLEDIPIEVSEASSQYREAQDILREFALEELSYDPNASTSAESLFAAFRKFAERRGENTKNITLRSWAPRLLSKLDTLEDFRAVSYGKNRRSQKKEFFGVALSKNKEEHSPLKIVS